MLLITVLFLLSAIPTLILVFGGRLSSQHDTVILASNGPSWVCQQPTTRREWRTLSEPEKLDYVTAVKCLATKPSKLRNNGTLYDDFPWVHKHLSSNSAFLFHFPFLLTLKNHHGRVTDVWFLQLMFQLPSFLGTVSIFIYMRRL